MLTKKTTRLKTVRKVHPRRISNKRLPRTRVLVAWGIAISGLSVPCSGAWCKLISLLLCEIPCSASHRSHLLTFCSAILYHIHYPISTALTFSYLELCCAMRALQHADRH